MPVFTGSQGAIVFTTESLQSAGSGQYAANLGTSDQQNRLVGASLCYVDGKLLEEEAASIADNYCMEGCERQQQICGAINTSTGLNVVRFRIM